MKWLLELFGIRPRPTIAEGDMFWLPRVYGQELDPWGIRKPRLVKIIDVRGDWVRYALITDKGTPVDERLHDVSRRERFLRIYMPYKAPSP